MRAFFKKNSTLTSKDYVWTFAGAILLSAALYLFLSLLFGGKILMSVFFKNTSDAFMDFFNSIRDASLGLGAYTERHVIYPPMANLFFMLLSHLTPDAYNQTDFEYRGSWDGYRSAIALITVFTILCALLFFALIRKCVQVKGKEAWLFSLVALFSIPFLNLLERGNIMSLALFGLLVFVFTYHSESPFVREIGLLALAFSFSLKLYPIIFAWILLVDKRYKEFFRCALYCILLLLLPSFAFGGPKCLWLIFQNIFVFSSGSGSTLATLSKYLGIPYGIVSGSAYVFFLICGLNFAVGSFVHKERWKGWACGCLMFLSFPSLTSTYGWTLFLIPICMMCNQPPQGLTARIYFAMMTIPFLFVPIPLPIAIHFNAFVVYFMTAFLAIFSVTDTCKAVINLIRSKKSVVTL